MARHTTRQRMSKRLRWHRIAWQQCHSVQIRLLHAVHAACKIEGAWACAMVNIKSPSQTLPGKQRDARRRLLDAPVSRLSGHAPPVRRRSK